MDAISYYNYRPQRAADFLKLYIVMDEIRVLILTTPSDRCCHDSELLWNYFLLELEILAKVLWFQGLLCINLLSTRF